MLERPWNTYTEIQIGMNVRPSSRRSRAARPPTPLVARRMTIATSAIQTASVEYSTARAVPVGPS